MIISSSSKSASSSCCNDDIAAYVAITCQQSNRIERNNYINNKKRVNITRVDVENVCTQQNSLDRLSYIVMCIIHRVPEKTSHFNFRHNFTMCWDIFTIFEAFCSGLISAWHSLLHTHHRCEAFTWCDITHDVCQAVARSVHWRQISYHLTYGVWTHRT